MPSSVSRQNASTTDAPSVETRAQRRSMPLRLQRGRDPVQQPDPVGAAQLQDDGAGGLVVEPQHAGRGGRFAGRRRGRVVALLARQRRVEREAAVEHADQVRAQQRRVGQAAEARRHGEAEHRRRRGTSRPRTAPRPRAPAASAARARPRPASEPGRSGASASATVTVAGSSPASRRSCGRPSAATAAAMLELAPSTARSGPGTASPASSARQRRTRSPISTPLPRGPHARARWRASRPRRARRAGRSRTAGSPLEGLDDRAARSPGPRGRVGCAVCGSSRWWRTIGAEDRRRRSGQSPSRRPICRRASSRRPPSGRSPRPLPMSCSSAPSSSRSGRATRVVSRAALRATSTRCRSTVQTCARSRGGRSRTAPHSGNSRPHRPVRSSDSTTSTSGRAGAEQRQQLAARRPRPRLAQLGRGVGEAVQGARGDRAARCAPRWPRPAAPARGRGRPWRRGPARPRPPCSTTPLSSGRRTGGPAQRGEAAARQRVAGRAQRRRRRRTTTVRAAPDSARARSKRSAMSRSAAATSSASWAAARRGRGRRSGAAPCARRAAASRAVQHVDATGRSTSWAAASASSSWTSRSPPWPFFRSGSTRWATSPERASRSWAASTSSSKRPRMPARQACRTAERDALRQLGSPAMCRASSRPSATRRSVAGDLRRPAPTVRTEWSSPMPASHSGYQSCSASRSTSFAPCRRAAARGRGRSRARARAVRARRPRRARCRRRAPIARAREASQKSCRSTSAVAQRRRAEPPLPGRGSSSTAFARTRSAAGSSHGRHGSPVTARRTPLPVRTRTRRDRRHPHLAVADLAGARRLDDRVDDLLDELVGTTSSTRTFGTKSTR